MESAKHWTPERGTPQGAVLSPLLSNIYLDPLDHRMAHLGYEMVRYADDFVIRCRRQLEAHVGLLVVGGWTAAGGRQLAGGQTGTRDEAKGGESADRG